MKNKKQNKQPNQRRSSRPKELAGMPPQINMHPISSRVYRFGGNSTNQTVQITRRCMLSLELSNANISGTGTAYTLVQAIRIKRVSVWCTTATPSLASFSVEWNDLHGPAIQKVASCTSSVAGHLVTRPPANSFSGMWSQVSSTSTYQEILFQLTVLANAIVDIECDVVYADGLLSNIEVISRTTNSTNGGVGYSYLDNSSSSGTAGTNYLAPQADQVYVYTN